MRAHAVPGSLETQKTGKQITPLIHFIYRRKTDESTRNRFRPLRSFRHRSQHRFLSRHPRPRARIPNRRFPLAEFSAPPTTLALFDPKKFRAEAPDPKIGGASIYLAVEDVSATVEELKEKGVPIAFDPMESPVCWLAGILDPDGNLVGLHQRKDGTWG